MREHDLGKQVGIFLFQISETWQKYNIFTCKPRDLEQQSPRSGSYHAPSLGLLKPSKFLSFRSKLQCRFSLAFHHSYPQLHTSVIASNFRVLICSNDKRANQKFEFVAAIPERPKRPFDAKLELRSDCRGPRVTALVEIRHCTPLLLVATGDLEEPDLLWRNYLVCNPQ